MNFLSAISKAIDTLNEWIGRGVSWVTLGFGRATMEDIAKEAELSPGTLYLYF